MESTPLCLRLCASTAANGCDHACDHGCQARKWLPGCMLQSYKGKAVHQLLSKIYTHAHTWGTYAPEMATQNQLSLQCWPLRPNAQHCRTQHKNLARGRRARARFYVHSTNLHRTNNGCLCCTLTTGIKQATKLRQQCSAPCCLVHNNNNKHLHNMGACTFRGSQEHPWQQQQHKPLPQLCRCKCISSPAKCTLNSLPSNYKPIRTTGIRLGPDGLLCALL